MQVMYVKRGVISRALEILNSAYAASQIDAKIKAGSRSAEQFLHRRFYPERRTVRYDWPNYSSSPTWEFDLGVNEVISLNSVTSGGTSITSNVILRRGDDIAEPPYNKLEIDLTSSASLSAGSTFQRSLVVDAVHGWSETSTSIAGGALSGAITDTATSLTIVPSGGQFSVDVGSLLLVESERIAIVDRRMATSGQTINANVSDTQATKVVSTAGAANFVRGETILIDSERMRIDDIAGTSLIVTRAYDGTVLEAHTSGATIYAERLFTALRGVLGSTAASHADTTAVYDHEYHPMLIELVMAETIVLLEQTSGAYARTIGTGAGTREAAGLGLDDVRERAFRALGRKNRSAAI